MSLINFADLKIKKKLGLSIAAPLILMVGLGAGALFSLHKVVKTADWVDHTRKVIAEAASVVSAAVDMETGMRGFVIAGRDTFLEPYKSGEKAAYSQIKELQQIVSDNPVQVARLAEAENLLRQWQVEIADQQIELRRQVVDATGMGAVVERVSEARGKEYFDKFRQVMADFTPKKPR